MSTDNKVSLNVMNSVAMGGKWVVSDNNNSFSMISSSGGCVCGNPCCAGGCFGPSYTKWCMGCGSTACTCYNYGICGACSCIPCVCQIYPQNNTATFNFAKFGILVKSAEKADILADFFGPGVNALVAIDATDGGASFIPFMDKFNMIWLQASVNSWVAYDRNEFMNWANSEDTVFHSVKLSKEEVIKRMMQPEKKNE